MLLDCQIHNDISISWRKSGLVTDIEEPVYKCKRGSCGGEGPVSEALLMTGDDLLVGSTRTLEVSLLSEAG